MKIKCPHCAKETEYSDSNPYRPFCGERCRTLDLGAWADEKYRVPVADAGANRRDDAADTASEVSPPPKHQLN